MQMVPYLLAVSLSLALQTTPAKQIAKVCFVRGEYIFVKDMKTGVEKRLVKGSDPALSPDGSTLAFSVDNLDSSTRDMKREIKLLDLASGKVTGLPSLEKFLCYGALWSPDGSKLAFHILKDKQWEVGVMDAERHELQVLTNKLSKSIGVYLSSWSPDSRSILCHDLDKIYQVDLKGETIKTIVTNEVVDDISYISSATIFLISADGRHLLFDTDTQPDDARLPMLWIYDLQLRKRMKISGSRMVASGPQWLGASDDEIIFTGNSKSARTQRTNVYRMRTDGTQVNIIVVNGSQASAALAP